MARIERGVGYGMVLLGGLALVAASAVEDLSVDWPVVDGISTEVVAAKGLSVAAVALLGYGFYLLVLRAIVAWSQSKRRVHDVRNVLRLVFLVAVGVAVLGVVTEEWVGVLFSLGVVGFGITFALQQPILSLIGWGYITLKRPYQVGDRVKIEDAKGDVIEVDFLVTTLWEINGDLVSSHQPSGRVVTVPNSVVLSSQVYNYSIDEFPYVWAETTVQVSYETDLEFARETMRSVADEKLGDEMERRVEAYRQALAETPVELEVSPRPSVNVVQEESWVELRLRFLTHPKRIQGTRNELYEEVLARFNAQPDRVSFPIGRNR